MRISIRKLSNLICFSVLLFSLQAHAAVWKATATWSDATEIDFQKWNEKVPTDIFSRPDNPFFGEADHPFRDVKENPYGNLIVDCSDAVCLLRVIFAHSRGLQFYMRGGQALVGGKVVDSNTSAYDGIKDPVARFRAFLKLTIDNCSTMTLDFDTYLVAPKHIAAGDVYRFNYVGIGTLDKRAEGRHAHIVRSVYPNGNIHFMWSSLPGFPRPFAEKIGVPEKAPMESVGSTVKVTFGRLGYRRFYQPQDYALSSAAMLAAQTLRGRDDVGQVEIFNASLAATTEKVSAAAQKRADAFGAKEARRQRLEGVEGEREAARQSRATYPYFYRKMQETNVAIEFAKRMSDVLRTGAPENVGEKVARLMKNICGYAKERSQNVFEGLIRREQLLRPNGTVQCMDAEDRGYYTTTGRDDQMRDSFAEMYRLWWGYEDTKPLTPAEKATVPSSVQSIVNLIFPNDLDRDSDENQAEPALNPTLVQFCQIDYWTPAYAEKVYAKTKGGIPAEYNETRTIDLRQLWLRILKERISLDPHDTVEQRWGKFPLRSRGDQLNCK